MFIRGRKLNISLVFITQSHFKVPKDVRLNSTHVLSWKFRIRENFNKLHWIIHQILALRILSISTKNILLNHIFFFLLILRFHQIILYDLEKIILTYNKIMTINDQIVDEKLQYNINREAAKISVLSSGKIDKYEYLTG